MQTRHAARILRRIGITLASAVFLTAGSALANSNNQGSQCQDDPTVLVDGKKPTKEIQFVDGAFDLNASDIGEIERVEVLYGDGSGSPVINFITKRDYGEKNTARSPASNPYKYPKIFTGEEFAQLSVSTIDELVIKLQSDELEGTIVLVNGRRTESDSNAVEDLLNAPASDIERVEVLLGDARPPSYSKINSPAVVNIITNQ